LKEKDICKNFYSKVTALQGYNYFGYKFFLFHIANEQNNNYAYTRELCRMGLRAGVSDYCLLYEGGRTVFIEFKRNEKCKLTVPQEGFRDVLNDLGFKFFVCCDADDGVEIIKSLNPNQNV
jgi:hypothetical protein